MDGFSIHLPIVGRYRSLGVATPTKLFAVGDQKDKLTNNALSAVVAMLGKRAFQKLSHAMASEGLSD